MRRLRKIAGSEVLWLLALWQLACGGGTGSAPETVYQPSKAPRDSPRFLNKKYHAKLPYDFQSPEDTDDLAWRYLADQGAVYVAQGGVIPPPTVQFASEEEVARWQATLAIQRLDYGEPQFGNFVELQAAAMEGFKKARDEIDAMGLSITPRGLDAGRRSFTDTLKFWQERVNLGLEHWILLRRLAKHDAERLRALSPNEQALEILRLEAQGLYFGKEFANPILASVSAPGTSQHLSLLALDIYEYENYDVRLALARHGWYQTIPSDLPHFTYLGVREGKLPELGLKRIIKNERAFWVTDVR